MTAETVPHNSTRLWLPIPAQQVIYTLSTDHYPWSEVFNDLAQRRDFTGVLEARSANRRAQALWIDGAFLGAYGRTDKTLEQFSMSFPRTLLRLYQADATLIRMAWLLRTKEPQELAQPWPAAAAVLENNGFSGVLMSNNIISYWQGGKPQAGTQPPTGPVSIVGELSPMTTTSLTEFWNEVLAQGLRQDTALLRAWENSAKALSSRHPCLDPFIKEVWLEGGRIHVAGTAVTELKPALLDVFLMAAQSIRFPLSTLKSTALGSHSLWKISGLGEAI